MAVARATPPPRDARYVHFKDELHRVVVDVADLSRIDRWSRDRLRTEVHDLGRKLAPQVDRQIPTAEVDRAVDEVVNEVFGLGPLEPLLADPTVTEVLVNAPDQVYVERGGLLQRAENVAFADKAHLVRVIQKIASRVGRRIDESSPMVDARLSDGSRVNAVLPPLTLDSPVLSIRRFGEGFTADQFVRLQSCTPEMIQFLETAIAAKMNTLISGGTGAGKTTLLNVLSAFIPPGERLVTIEDAAELKLQQPHVVRMETRTANLEGAGSVSQRDLLRNALRMRPDRIILGEARGPEAVDMLQAMNTGHEGSLTTVHANDTRDALGRLELMIGLSGVDLATPVLRGYIANAFHLLVHVARLAGGNRKITRISELLGIRKGRIYRVRDIFVFEQTGVVNGHAVGTFKATGYLPHVLSRLAAMGRPLPESMFAARDLAKIGPPASGGTAHA
ncbi:MAG TPA: CpaF family protein [Urbifossiella sp.]|nr:CpaF family protein [Urbifossiella sp.]